MADIQPPDLETKMAILDKKAEVEGVALPEDVRTFMATKTKSNVRELEGALVKLIAYSSLTGSAINLAMAQQVLRHLVYAQDRKITIDSIQKGVADRYGIRQSQLKEKSNTKKIVVPRQVAMYLVKELTSASLPEIGQGLWGQASYHRTAFGQENRQAAAHRSGIEQDHPRPNRFITMSLPIFSTTGCEDRRVQSVQKRPRSPGSAPFRARNPQR